MAALFRSFVSCEAGATAIEYGLIATLIGVAIIVGATAVGTSINGVFETLAGVI